MSDGPATAPALPWSGERYVPELPGDIRLEHLHRYAIARQLCVGRRVLDIACGEGYGSSLLAQVAAHVSGVDIAAEAVSHARARYLRPNLEFRVGSCSAIPLTDASVDVVVSFETIEHHAEHDAMMREVRRVLVPGGTFILSSPDRREYSDVPKQTNPFHVRELYRDELEHLLRANFAHVVLAGQRIKAGSLVWPLDDQGPRRFDGFTAGAGPDEVAPLGAALYLLAAASDAPVGPIPSGILDGGAFVWFGDHAVALRTAEQRAHEAAQREAALRQAVLVLEADLTASRGLADHHAAMATALQAELTETEGKRIRLAEALHTIETSASWRLTAPLRALRRRLSGQGSPTDEGVVRSLYAALPMSAATRLRVRSLLFRSMPFLFGRTEAYRAWAAYQQNIAQSSPVSEPKRRSADHSDVAGSFPRWFFAPPAGDYVPLTESPGVDTRIKAVAFYLPQFHPIPENDRWWGKGFTEWANVTRGKPQFEGHYQPHLPGELGFYDLRIPGIQRRQIELAKAYGLFGFCYHHYWFAGRRLLRQPLEQLLASPDLDFPFCLCWANENWTRRWDGKESEILIGQQHSPDDDIAFIRDIDAALRDPRYIRIDGRPLLIVYRPALLPDARATAARWRQYCREAGLNDPYLASTHAFDRIDPRSMGFDAAIEFAPNNLGAPAVTDQMKIVNPDFAGVVYDYRYLVEYSRTCVPPSYTLFRSVTPMWDNEARRPGRGAVFAHASPALYREALEHTCRYTDEHLGTTGPFVFVNAWNEWAEGAHLEPDARHGYAFLQATADALRRFPHVRTTG